MTNEPISSLIASFDASNCFSTEASIYGTPLGLAWLARHFLDVASRQIAEHTLTPDPKGPLLITGTNIRINFESSWKRAAKSAEVNTTRMFRDRRSFHKSNETETTELNENCMPRPDGGFAVAYPEFPTRPTLVITGNSLGLEHIADGLNWMSEIIYPPFDPQMPEKSEHHHSWLDRDEDAMLACGLGLLYGRMDHRRNGDISWIVAMSETWASEMSEFVDFRNGK